MKRNKEERRKRRIGGEEERGRGKKRGRGNGRGERGNLERISLYNNQKLSNTKVLTLFIWGLT